ncbi:MAG TPA: 6-bladed beta-propeller, partial [Gemmatimonadales bacterium]|nr:6-bladed beta-propeller [Gemmatimonadales bacterium]
MTSIAPTAWADTNGWKLVEVASIAPAAGSPGELINPSSMAVDDWGRVYVADQSPVVIKVYDSAGAFVRTIGREGEGPGEFRVAFIAVRGNRLMVHDPQLQRTTLFDTSGALVRSFHSVGIVWADRVALDAAQRAVLPILTLEPGDASAEPAEMFVRFDSLGRQVDTIRVPAITQEHVWQIMRDGRPSASVSIPFAPRTAATFGADSGIVYGATSDYSIVVSTGHNDTTRIIRRTWDEVPLPDSLRERAFKGIVTGMTERLGEAAVQNVFHLG